ncbi:MAG: YraN family protein [Clostridiales bacterium]|nr:YraN family protein [Clostridiales bacterium]
MDMQGGNSPAQAMDRHRKTLGKQGEDIASAWLAAEGMRILHRNYRCRTGEIDIIGSIGGVLAFIEVRSRSSDRWGLPSESVNDRKKQKLQKLASYYLYQKGKTELPYRFDVVSILFSQDGGVERLDWIQNAF